MCFGDPWEGEVPVEQVVAVGKRLFDLGASQLSLGDTIGVGTAGHVTALVEAFVAAGMATDQLALHFHDTYGQALANAYAGLAGRHHDLRRQRGRARRLPLRKSATGNLATEDLVWMLTGLGIEHGVDLDALVATSAWMAGHAGPSQPVGGGASAGTIATVSQRVYLHIGAPKTRHHLPPGPAGPQPPLARPARRPLPLPAAAGQRGPCSSSARPSTCSARTGVAIPATPRACGRRSCARSGVMAAPCWSATRSWPPAKPEKVARARATWQVSEVHVVYSRPRPGPPGAGGLAGEHQAGSRAGPTRRFLRRVESGKAWFARAFDLPTVLTSWGAGLEPDHVHVVTVPRREQAIAQPDLLWQRFCEAFGIDPAWAPRDSTRHNASLGIAETQVLRRLNQRLGTTARRGAVYDRLVRERLAESEFVGRPSPPVRLPPTSYPWALERTERWIEWLESSGVHVVGDLDDLRPQPTELPWHDPDRVSAAKQLAAALDALAAMTREAGRRPDPDRALVNKVRMTARRLRE